jgi:hypothetical protein
MSMGGDVTHNLFNVQKLPKRLNGTGVYHPSYKNLKDQNVEFYSNVYDIQAFRFTILWYYDI